MFRWVYSLIVMVTLYLNTSNIHIKCHDWNGFSLGNGQLTDWCPHQHRFGFRELWGVSQAHSSFLIESDLLYKSKTHMKYTITNRGGERNQCYWVIPTTPNLFMSYHLAKNICHHFPTKAKKQISLPPLKLSLLFVGILCVPLPYILLFTGPEIRPWP